MMQASTSFVKILMQRVILQTVFYQKL